MPEASLHQFVGSEHFAAEVLWQEQNRDDNSGQKIPEDHLEKAEVSVKCERRRPDDGQSTRFGGHDRETDSPPWRVPASKEIVLERFLRGSETRTEPRDADKIGEDDTDIEVAHRMHWSLAHGILESSVMAGTSRPSRASISTSLLRAEETFVILRKCVAFNEVWLPW